MSLRDAPSRADSPAVAPPATSSSAGPGLRLYTVSGKPAVSRLLAIGRPMIPSPMNPMRSTSAPSREDEPVLPEPAQRLVGVRLRDVLEPDRPFVTSFIEQ